MLSDNAVVIITFITGLTLIMLLAFIILGLLEYWLNKYYS